MHNYQCLNYDTDFKKQVLAYGNKIALQISNACINYSLNGLKYICSAWKGLIMEDIQ